jgi:hypothetical protein
MGSQLTGFRIVTAGTLSLPESDKGPDSCFTLNAISKTDNRKEGAASLSGLNFILEI